MRSSAHTRTEKIRDEVKAIFAGHGVSDKLRGDFVVITPLTGELICSVAADSTATINSLVQKSRIAQGKWAQLELSARGEFLNFLAARVNEKSADLAKLVHFDSGKSVKESLGEVASTVGLINGIIRAASYEPLVSGAERSKEFSALGVIAVVSPFNFALAIGMWTGVPALLAGNTVINKPSENAFLTPILYEAIFKAAIRDFNEKQHEDLVPRNIFQVAVGGPEIGKALVEDERIAKVIFTGSIAGCESVKKADSNAHRRSKALTEGGAANFAVFSNLYEGMPREEYIKFAVGAIMKSYLPYAGQKCINTRQVVVHKDIFESVIEEFRGLLAAFKVRWQVDAAFCENNPFEFTALINRRAGERFQWALQQVIQQGGELIGGERLGSDEYPDAQYFMPAVAIFKGHVPLMDEEIFGPFLTIVPYTNGIDGALALAQKPNANLVNAYYGSNVEEARMFKRKNTAGFSLINPPLGTGLLPPYGLGFGGNGLSGQGESLPRDPLLPFVDLDGPIKRSVTFRLPAVADANQ